MLVSIENLSKSFGGHLVLEDVSLKIEDHDRIGLIGVNGAGKSTLIKMMTGDETPDTGGVALNAEMTIGYLEQNSGLSRENSILEEMRLVFQPVLKLEQEMRRLEQEMAGMDHQKENARFQEASARYAVLEEQFQKNDGYLVDVKIKSVLNGMGFGDKAFETVVSTLSGGEKTRLAIAKLLLEQPSLLILDEPTNHLDFKTLMWLEDYLKDYKGALLIVSHDRYFLDKLVTSVCEMEKGRLFRYKGNYTQFLRLKEEKIQRQMKEYERQQEEIASLEDFVAKNIVRASSSKSAKSRRNTLERMERIEKPDTYQKPPKIQFSFDRPPVKDVLHVQDLKLEVGEGENRQALAESVSFDMLRGEKIALIGSNGVGKSTLLKVIQGLLPASRGEVGWGKYVKIAYYDQENATLNPDNTVLEELWGRHPTVTEQEIRTRLGAVLLTGENVYKKVGNLSGGERAKLAFAVLIGERGNVLLLDEPTNHMDLNTKEVIDTALTDFEGTILMVSHDRYLLNRVPGKIMEMFPGHIEVYDGNFDYYLEKSAERRAKEAQEQQQEKETEQMSDTAAQFYRSKQKRSEEAQRRRKIKEAEERVASQEELIRTLEAEINDPQTAADFKLLHDKCAELEEARGKLSEYMEEWLAVSE